MSSSEKEDVEVPDEFVCPITYKIMKDPVITFSGHSYDRDAIRQWLSTHDTDPMTNQRLTNKILIPNRALRKQIQSFIAKNGNKIKAIKPANNVKNDVIAPDVVEPNEEKDEYRPYRRLCDHHQNDFLLNENDEYDYEQKMMNYVDIDCEYYDEEQFDENDYEDIDINEAEFDENDMDEQYDDNHQPEYYEFDDDPEQNEYDQFDPNEGTDREQHEQNEHDQFDPNEDIEQREECDEIEQYEQEYNEHCIEQIGNNECDDHEQDGDIEQYQEIELFDDDLEPFDSDQRNEYDQFDQNEDTEQHEECQQYEHEEIEQHEHEEYDEQIEQNGYTQYDDHEQNEDMEQHQELQINFEYEEILNCYGDEHSYNEDDF